MKITAPLIALLLLTSPLPAADWPNFRGPNTDAIVPSPAIDKLAVTPVWKAPLGESFGQLTVAGDKAFAFIKRGEQETAICLDAKTGKELWHTDTDKALHENHGDGPRTTPAISGDRIYLFGAHLKLTCLDLADGHEIWKHSLLTEFGGKEPGYGNSASPIVVDDVVIVTSPCPGKGILGFNKNSGELAWSKSNDKGTYASPTLATILGAKQVICFMNSGLVSVAPKTGEILWSFDFPVKTVGASAVVGGKNGDIVYCSSGYNVGAVACKISKNADKWEAAQLWRTPKKSPNHWSTPVYHDGYIYGLVGQCKPDVNTDGALSCVDIETGNIKWSQDNIGAQGGLILLGDKLLIQTPTGDLLLAAASPDGFKDLGRVPGLPGKNWTAPACANDHLFIRNFTEAACLKLVPRP